MANPTNQIPASQNEAWGFFGTISHHAEPRAAWNLAMTIVAEVTGQPYDDVRAFLDSRHGRHFADEVSNHMDDDASKNEAAIRTAAQTWMGWKIGRRLSRQDDIPMGLSYLLAYVVRAAQEAENAE